MPIKAFLLSILFLARAGETWEAPALSDAGIKALYRKACTFYGSAHPSPRTDSLAISLFEQVIRELELTHTDDRILFQAYQKKGVLLDVKGNYGLAIRSYGNALACFKNHADWSDSLLFSLYVYIGPDYYHLENFDSAYAMLHKAETLAGRYPGMPQQERLYNTLGALYYESGNYLQSKNYFNRALTITMAAKKPDKEAAADFENNIASCLYKMGEYRQSLDKYRELVKKGNFSSQVFLNMGKAHISLAEYGQGLDNYRRVRPKEVPGVYNEIAYAQLLLGRPDSAFFYLDKWRLNRDKGPQSPLDAGVNDLYRAEVLESTGACKSGIGYLQQSIINFSGRFRNEDIHANPVNFIGSFASYRLFDAIFQKARALEKLYGVSHEDEWLTASFSAYNSAIGLFRYIEKSYTTDDAKLFLKKNNAELYENSIRVCLQLDRLHPDGRYLEQAFLMAEKTKASIVSANVEQFSSNKLPGINPHLLEMEKNIKYKIARLDLKTDPEQGNPGTPEMAKQKADYEMELSMIQNRMELNSSYYRLKYEDSCPGVHDLQRTLTGQQALISLYVSGTGLHIFTLTSSSFHHLLIDSVMELKKEVKGWIDMLNRSEPGRRFGDKHLAASLYKKLVSPLLASLGDKAEWIIIPSDIFYLLPFESLPADENNGLLIEKTTISYELSTEFLRSGFMAGQHRSREYKVLSFAPFERSGEWVNTRSLRFLEGLPNSLFETEGLPGKRFIGNQASKSHFLAEMNHFPVIHLATHAFSDQQNLAGSFIAFYPQRGAAEEDCLFLEELYGLNLDSTKLVILSACETGAGEIVDNEGLLSISRGFIYAGCPSVVSSLWKADDRSSAAILRKFHVYLEEGYSKSTALRQAKLDYIHENELNITPDYWANLVLVGNTDPIIGEPVHPIFYLCLFIGGMIVVAGMVFIWRSASAYPRDSYS